jgi:hypothetical protein
MLVVSTCYSAKVLQPNKVFVSRRWDVHEERGDFRVSQLMSILSSSNVFLNKLLQKKTKVHLCGA